MNMSILLPALLILHLAGLTLTAGTTVAEYITLKTFSALFDKDRERSLSLLDLLKKLSALLGIGIALLVLSGIGLFLITKGVFIHQIWFRIKLALILTIILNGFIVGGRQESKLKNSISQNNPEQSGDTKAAILNLKLFFLAQIGLLFLIVILSIFKFS